MPTRLIREGWKDSERVNKLSPGAEVFFLRLCLAADDYNRYVAHPKLLASHLYPLKESVGDPEILEWLTECMEAELVIVYETVGAEARELGRQELGTMNRARAFIWIARFRQRTRSERSKYPPPPESAVRRLEPEAVDKGSKPPDAGHMTGRWRADAGHARAYSYSYSDSDSDSDAYMREPRAREASQKAENTPDYARLMPWVNRIRALDAFRGVSEAGILNLIRDEHEVIVEKAVRHLEECYGPNSMAKVSSPLGLLKACLQRKDKQAGEKEVFKCRL